MMPAYLPLTVAILAGLLILDVAICWIADRERIERRRQRDRDQAAMLRTLDRTNPNRTRR